MQKLTQQDPESATAEISFIELGSANNSAELVSPLIKCGYRGVFIDANQDLLTQRQQALLEDKQSHRHHIFICCLIGLEHKFEVFYPTKFGYSSSNFRHVIGHIVADAANNKLNEERRTQKITNVHPITMCAITLEDILNSVGQPNLMLLNIDLEGLDCKILASAKFDYCKPTYICFEHSHSESPFEGKGDWYKKAVENLQSQGYEIAINGTNDTLMTLKPN